MYLNKAMTVVDMLGWKGIWRRKSDAMEALRGIRDLIGHPTEK